jgi:multiple sugar transport system permease protein
MTGRLDQRNIGLLLITPLFLYVMGMILFPFMMNIWLSFTNKRIGMPTRFIGLDNYLYWLKNPDFLLVLGNTLIYTVVTIVVKFLLGLASALLLNRKFWGRNFFRIFYLIPWVLPSLVTCFTWRWLLDDLVGLVNFLMTRVGLHGIAWLSRPGTALGSVIWVNIWRGFPFFGILLLAALQSIPDELYDAARVDGAGPIASFRHVTLPGIRQIAMIAVMLSTIWTFNDFEIVFLLTRGGPGYSTMIMVPFVYEVGIRGMAIARAITFPVLVFPVLLALIFLTSRMVLRED